MRRTTSMSGGISNNLDSHEVHDSIIDPSPYVVVDQNQTNDAALAGMVMSPSPTTSNNSHPPNQTTIIDPVAAHVIQTPHFLRICCLCKRHLTLDRDIYMYRGDTAFCSLECREHQIRQDQRKWKVASNKEDHHAPPSTAATRASINSGTAACN